jgi:hypothetical protein
MTIVIERDDSAPASRRIVVETDDFTAIKPASRTETSEFAAVRRRAQTGDVAAVEALPAQSGDLERWAESGYAEPGPDFAAAAPNGRRTIKISGHPDHLPVRRTQRPPRTVVERLGTSPDRIAAYAVALGFLLVLIAVLTTGQ